MSLLKWIEKLFNTKAETDDTTRFVKGQKVYWINGWPNNGIGTYVSYSKRLKKFKVLNENEEPVICNDVDDLREAINRKKNNLEGLGDPKQLSSNMKNIYYGNLREIEDAEEFLSQT